MRTKKSITILILVVFFYVLILSKSFAETYVYKVAGDRQFPPYEFVDEEGNYRGFNIDLLKTISLVSGLEFEFIPMRWEDAYHSIDKGQADMIQGMKESDERKNKFLFSDSVLINSQSIFVLNEDEEIKSERDFPGKKVALNKQDSLYPQLNSIEKIEIIEVDSLEEALESLLTGETDALIGNTQTVNYLCKERDVIDKIKIVGKALNEQKYSIAVGHENQALLSEINRGLEIIQKNGMYDSIYRKWFGTPIKNETEKMEGLLNMSMGIIFFLIVLVTIFLQVNQHLKNVIERKVMQQQTLVHELRHYDKLQFMNKIILSIAHEIRNPLTSIRIYTGQMKSKMDNKEFLKAAAEEIPAEIDRIDGLIKEFMEYSAPRKPVLSTLNLWEELSNAGKFFQYQKSDIVLDIQVNKQWSILFDVYQFKQMILNILLNSKDAVKNIKTPTITITAEEFKDEIHIFIRDNGCGMKSEELPFIFEPFYTTKEFGNGVGMFVVKQIVSDNGGKIRADSKGLLQGMEIEITVRKGDDHENQITDYR